MADEETPTLTEATRIQNQIVDRATTLAKEGYDIIRKCGDLVNDIMKLDGLNEMEKAYFVGRFDQLTGAQAKADLALFMQAIAGIAAQLEAKDSEQSKALARLSVYSA